MQITMNTIEVTTAEVVAWPTAAELRPHCMPRRQPATATTTPYTAALDQSGREVGQLEGILRLLQVGHGR